MVEYPLYIGTRKTSMPYNICTSKYACIDLQEPNEIQFGRKHKVNQEESTPKCDTKKKVVQIISKSKSTHDWGKIKSTHDWFQNTSTHEVWYQKESNQHNKWLKRHQLKIRYQLKQK